MNQHAIATINVEQLKQQMEQNPGLCLIDVREVHEWQGGHIPGAVLIPKDELTARIENTCADRDTAIYLHCKGGVRSLYAAHCLLDMGYKQVYSVDGGIMDWEAHGYPVVD